MMKSLESFSLAEFQQFRDVRPDCAGFADFVLAKTHEQFLNVLYRDLDECIRLMEEDPAVRKDDGEDRLTEDFKVFLRAKGYQATHDEKIGGHSDLVVRKRDLPYIWLGEAKIHSDYGYLEKGFNQLCSRYSPGTPGTNHGGLLIYIYQEKAARVLERWKCNLAEAGFEDYSHQDCLSRPGLAFFSTHCHASSGLPITVRHMAIVLHFDPQDR